MQLLTNYQDCFDDEFKAHEDTGLLKILCVACGDQAVVSSTTAEKRITCTCGVGACYTCSNEFYLEMQTAAASMVVPDIPEVEVPLL